MEMKGYALYTGITIKEYMETFLKYKEDCGIVEPSTIKGYKAEVRQMCKYIGAEKLGEQLNIPATAIPYSVDKLKAMLAVFDSIIF